jgi:hypothetical protein
MKTPDGRIPAPPFSKGQIISMAGELIAEHVRVVGRKEILSQGLSFNQVYETVIYPKYEIEIVEDEDLGVDEDGKKILGCFDIEHDRAYIDPSLARERSDPRRTFTLWHEVGGHGVLQGEWLRAQLSARKHGGRLVTTEESLSSATQQRLERQANVFAAHASAPAWLVDTAIALIFQPTKPFVYFRPGYYWLDMRGSQRRFRVSSFEDLCCLIAKEIKHKFDGLSTESLSYRVAESRQLVNRASAPLLLPRVARLRASSSSPAHCDFAATLRELLPAAGTSSAKCDPLPERRRGPLPNRTIRRMPRIETAAARSA